MGIASLTGLGGNSSPVLLDNKGKINKLFAKDALKSLREKLGKGYELQTVVESLEAEIEIGL